MVAAVVLLMRGLGAMVGLTVAVSLIPGRVGVMVLVS
jgi:hypothetical protein